MKDHSGFSAVDIDNIPIEDLPAIKSLMEEDKYCATVFTSVSGMGLCVIVSVRPSDHLQNRDGLFRGSQDYLFEEYEISIDKLADFSRLRFVSHDSDLRVNLDYETFIPPTKQQRKQIVVPANVSGIFDESDFFKKGVLAQHGQNGS